MRGESASPVTGQLTDVPRHSPSTSARGRRWGVQRWTWLSARVMSVTGGRGRRSSPRDAEFRRRTGGKHVSPLISPLRVGRNADSASHSELCSESGDGARPPRQTQTHGPDGARATLSALLRGNSASSVRRAEHGLLISLCHIHTCADSASVVSSTLVFSTGSSQVA